jgi:ribonuclease HI
VQQFEIYTDGSDKGRWGSWSYLVLRQGQIISESSGRARKTNSNRMEFQAVILALESLPANSEFEKNQVTLFTDCKILIDNVNKFSAWQAADWLRKNKLPIANADLFRQLYALMQKHNVTWKWVRAHSGNPFNERCDQLCRLARGPEL